MSSTGSRERSGGTTQDSAGSAESSAPAPGKSSLTAPLQMRAADEPPPYVGEGYLTAPPVSPVQRKGGSPDDVFSLHVAADGVAGAGQPLPHLDQIQASFGRHDVRHVDAHVGGQAADAATNIGAQAYATGSSVAFREQPDVHTAAHEAAHVVQQRGGVQLRGGVGQVGDRYEQHADAVADRVVAGQSAEPLLDEMAGDGRGSAASAGDGDGAVQKLAGDGEPGVGGDDIRVIILNIALGATPLLPMIAVINAAGMSVTAGAVGLRGSFALGAGVGGGAGVDGMLFFDVANAHITGDVLPWAELSIGVTEGAGFGVIFGFRLSPHGTYGDPSESYSGRAINASVEALAGAGFSISPGVLSGNEGWVCTILTLGEQFGATVSVSHAESARLVSAQINSAIQRATASLRSVVASLGAIADGVNSAVRSMFQSVFRIFFPEQWNLAGYLPHEATAIRQFGTYMNQVIAASGGIDAFLASESASPAPSISERIRRHSTWDILGMIAVNNALNARYHRMMGGTEATVGNIWEPTHFNTTSYLNFLRFCMDNGLIA